LKPKVINDSLSEGCIDSVVTIESFCRIERCDSQRHTAKTFENALGSLRMERLIFRSIAY